MKNKVRDILADKKVKLQELTAQAEAAVDLVTRTISGLELVNQEIMIRLQKLTSILLSLRVRDRRSARIVHTILHSLQILQNFWKFRKQKVSQ